MSKIMHQNLSLILLISFFLLACAEDWEDSYFAFNSRAIEATRNKLWRTSFDLQEHDIYQHHSREADLFDDDSAIDASFFDKYAREASHGLSRRAANNHQAQLAMTCPAGSEGGNGKKGGNENQKNGQTQERKGTPPSKASPSPRKGKRDLLEKRAPTFIDVPMGAGVVHTRFPAAGLQWTGLGGCWALAISTPQEAIGIHIPHGDGYWQNGVFIITETSHNMAKRMLLSLSQAYSHSHMRYANPRPNAVLLTADIADPKVTSMLIAAMAHIGIPLQKGGYTVGRKCYSTFEIWGNGVQEPQMSYQKHDTSGLGL